MDFFLFLRGAIEGQPPVLLTGSHALVHLLETAETKLSIAQLHATDTTQIGIYRWLWPADQKERMEKMLRESEKVTSDLALALRMKEADVHAATTGGSSSSAAASSSSSSEAKLLSSAIGMFFSS